VIIVGAAEANPRVLTQRRGRDSNPCEIPGKFRGFRFRRRKIRRTG
jgi:hypothetical protein